MNDLTVTEYKDVRVLTTQQIAEAYGTDEKVISKNFNNNKERYTEGKHFICLIGEELKEFLQSSNLRMQNSSKVRSLYLWTKKGAFLHAKSLNTDTAWEVYDRLVDSYFESQMDFEGLSQELKAVIVVDKRVTKIEQRVERLEYDIPLYGSEADELCNHVKYKGTEMLGGKDSNAYKDSGVSKAVYRDIYNQIKREYGLYDDKGRFKSYKALKRRYITGAHEIVEAYELPMYLEEKVNDCNAQISMNTKEKE